MKKYRQVKVNLKPEDYDRISTEAEAAGVTIAQYFRELADAKIENAPVAKPRPDFRPTDPALLYELKRIGTNLNQIAKQANTSGAVDRAVLSQLVEIERQLGELL